MILFFVSSLLAVSCTANVLPESKETRLARAANDFAFELFGSLSNGKKNVFISPFSISTALAMTYQGADDTTAQAMRRVLGYDKYGLSEKEVPEAFHSVLVQLKQNASGYNFSSYNGALIQESFPVLETYENTLRDQYFAQVRRVDFRTQGEAIRSEINSDVENATRGKVRGFLDKSPNPKTELCLINAVYFLGSWLIPFNKHSTYEGSFYNNGFERKPTKMMSRQDVYSFSRDNELNASVVILPYRGASTASMIIVLPQNSTGVAELQQRITRESLDRAVATCSSDSVRISVPKFKLEHSAELAGQLTGLGLEELFSDGANLSRIAGQDFRLKVNKIIHKAVVELNEEGTEAAAASGVEIVYRSFGPIIVVEHPFLFFIREDRHGLILFSGRVDEL